MIMTYQSSFLCCIRECNECNSIVDCGFCFNDDPVDGVTRGSCLLTKENTTSLSDYGPCSNLSNAVYRSFVFFCWAPHATHNVADCRVHSLAANRDLSTLMDGVPRHTDGSRSLDWWPIYSFSLRVFFSIITRNFSIDVWVGCTKKEWDRCRGRLMPKSILCGPGARATALPRRLIGFLISSFQWPFWQSLKYSHVKVIFDLCPWLIF